jgi:Benzoyl-CoA reductase/2-hydroxyglutaryl-CoA dehydratase subunit, BcrC/BadD/HgdB
MIQLPENFETYAEARKAGFLRMKQLKESGRKVVGIFCSFVPTELIEAAGGTAAPLCATSEEPISAAEADLPKNLCPLIKASYGFALTDTCPYFYFSDFIVGETTCDGKKKCLS